MPQDDLDALFAIDRDSWLREADLTEEFYDTFDGRVPAALRAELHEMLVQVRGLPREGRTGRGHRAGFSSIVEDTHGAVRVRRARRNGRALTTSNGKMFRVRWSGCPG